MVSTLISRNIPFFIIPVFPQISFLIPVLKKPISGKDVATPYLAALGSFSKTSLQVVKQAQNPAVPAQQNNHYGSKKRRHCKGALYR
jgi:hypothetical protein